MTTESWLLLSLTLLAGAASPGPSLALVVRTALAHGRLAGVTVAVAHGVGVGLYALLIVLGVAEVMSRVVWIMAVLQVGGIVFLAYLSVSMIRGGVRSLQQSNDQNLAKPASYPMGQRTYLSHLRDGFLIVFLNPKVLIFFLAIFSQFLSPDQSLAAQLTAVGLAATIDGAWYAVIALVISMPRIDAALARFSGYLDVGFGVCLSGVAVLMSLSFLWR